MNPLRGKAAPGPSPTPQPPSAVPAGEPSAKRSAPPLPRSRPIAVWLSLLPLAAVGCFVGFYHWPASHSYEAIHDIDMHMRADAEVHGEEAVKQQAIEGNVEKVFTTNSEESAGAVRTLAHAGLPPIVAEAGGRQTAHEALLTDAPPVVTPAPSVAGGGIVADTHVHIPSASPKEESERIGDVPATETTAEKASTSTTAPSASVSISTQIGVQNAIARPIFNVSAKDARSLYSWGSLPQTYLYTASAASSANSVVGTDESASARIATAGSSAVQHAVLNGVLGCHLKGRRGDGVNFYYSLERPTSQSASAQSSISGEEEWAAVAKGGGRRSRCVSLPTEIAPRSPIPPNPTIVQTIDYIDNGNIHDGGDTVWSSSASDSEAARGEGSVEALDEAANSPPNRQIEQEQRIALRNVPSRSSRWLFEEWRLWEGELGCRAPMQQQQTIANDGINGLNPLDGGRGGDSDKESAKIAIDPEAFETVSSSRPDGPVPHVYELNNFCVDEDEGWFIRFVPDPSAAGEATTQKPPPPPAVRFSPPVGYTEYTVEKPYDTFQRFFSGANTLTVPLKGPPVAGNSMMDGANGGGEVRASGPQRSVFRSVVAASLEDFFHVGSSIAASSGAAAAASHLSKEAATSATRLAAAADAPPSVMFHDEEGRPAYLYPLEGGSDDNPGHTYYRIATAQHQMRELGTSSIVFLTDASSGGQLPKPVKGSKDGQKEELPTAVGDRASPIAVSRRFRLWQLCGHSVTPDTIRESLSSSSFSLASLPSYLLKTEEMATRDTALAANGLSPAHYERFVATQGAHEEGLLAAMATAAAAAAAASASASGNISSSAASLAFSAPSFSVSLAVGVPREALAQIGRRPVDRSTDSHSPQRAAAAEVDGSRRNFFTLSSQYSALLSSGAEGCESHRCGRAPFASSSPPPLFPSSATSSHGNNGKAPHEVAGNSEGLCSPEGLSAHRRCAVPYLVAPVFQSGTQWVTRQPTQQQPRREGAAAAAAAPSSPHVPYEYTTEGYPRHVWAAAVRAIYREAKLMRRLVAAMVEGNEKTEGKSAENEEAEDRVFRLLVLAEVEAFGPTATSLPPAFAYVLEWRRRMLPMLAAMRADEPNINSRKDAEADSPLPATDTIEGQTALALRHYGGASGGEVAALLPSTSVALKTRSARLRDYFHELFAVLLEEGLTRSSGAGGSKDGGIGRASSTDQQRAVKPRRRHLSCYRKAYAHHVRHPAHGYIAKFHNKGHIIAIAPANCNSREALRASYDAYWQRYGSCAAEVRSGSSEGLGALDTNRAAPQKPSQQLSRADEPSRDAGRDAHPLFALPQVERQRLRELFDSSRAEQEAILAAEATRIRKEVAATAGSKAAEEKRGEELAAAFGLPFASYANNSSSISSDKEADYFARGGAPLLPYPWHRGGQSPIAAVASLIAKLDAAQRRYDDAFMAYFRRHLSDGEKAPDENGVLGRPIRIMQPHRSLSRAFVNFRSLFTALAAPTDSLLKYVDFDFNEGTASGVDGAAEGRGPHRQPLLLKDSQEGSRREYAMDSRRSRHFSGVLSADLVIGQHGADFHVMAVAKPSALTVELTLPGMDLGDKYNSGFFAPMAFSRNVGYLRIAAHRVHPSPDPLAEGADVKPAHRTQSMLTAPELRQAYAVTVCAWLATNAVRLADEAKAGGPPMKSSAERTEEAFSFLVPWWCRGGPAAVARSFLSAFSKEEGNNKQAQRDQKEPDSDTALNGIPPPPPLSQKQHADELDVSESHLRAAESVVAPSYYSSRAVPSAYGFVAPYCVPLEPTVSVAASSGGGGEGSRHPSSTAYAIGSTVIGHRTLVGLQNDCARNVTSGTFGEAGLRHKEHMYQVGFNTFLGPALPQWRRAAAAQRLRVEGLQSLLESALLLRPLVAQRLAAAMVLGVGEGSPEDVKEMEECGVRYLNTSEAQFPPIPRSPSPAVLANWAADTIAAHRSAVHAYYGIGAGTELVGQTMLRQQRRGEGSWPRGP